MIATHPPLIGIVPAAGTASRLDAPKGKALLDINGKPLITYPLRLIAELEPERIVIVQHEARHIERALGDSFQGTRLVYVQQRRPTGITSAVLEALPLCLPGANFCIVLGDIFYIGSLRSMYSAFLHSGRTCFFGAQRVLDKAAISFSYGLTYSNEIVEKPDDTKELWPFLGLGIYFAKSSFSSHLRWTARNATTNEYEFTDTLNRVESRTFCLLDGDYVNVNTPEDLESALSIARGEQLC